MVKNRRRFGIWEWRSRILMPLVGVVLGLAANSPLRAQTHVGQYEQADIAYGSSLYATHCVVCHGADGDAMPGVNLRSGRFRHASSDRELANILRAGIPGTAMIPGTYDDSELTALVAYLRNIDADVAASHWVMRKGGACYSRAKASAQVVTVSPVKGPDPRLI